MADESPPAKGSSSSRPKPVSNRQAGQIPCRASAGIRAPHFSHALSTLFVWFIHEMAKFFVSEAIHEAKCFPQQGPASKAASRATTNPSCGGPQQSKGWRGVIASFLQNSCSRVRSWLVLCPQNANEMAQLILDVSAGQYSVRDFFAQELSVTLPHPIGRLRDGARSHS